MTTPTAQTLRADPESRDALDTLLDTDGIALRDLAWGLLVDRERIQDHLTRESTRGVVLARLAAGLLAEFAHERGHPGEPCHRSGWVADTTITRWHQTYREATS